MAKIAFCLFLLAACSQTKGAQPDGSGSGGGGGGGGAGTGGAAGAGVAGRDGGAGPGDGPVADGTVRPDLAPDGRGGTAGTGGTGGTGGTTYVYFSGSDPQITIYTLGAAGALTGRRMVSAPLQPGYMAFSPDKRRLYAVSDRITAYTIDPANGGLSPIDPVDVPIGGGSGAAHITVHPSGRFLATALYTSGQVAVTSVLPSGAPGPRTDLRDTAAQAHQAIFSADGGFLFVPCRNGNAVMQYLIDAAGKLTPNTPPSAPAMVAGSGPRHMAFHPTRPMAYVLNESIGTITSYKVDRGLLADPQAIRTTPDPFDERASAHIVVHPTGRFVYASNRNHNSIAAFAVDEASGRLSLLEYELGDGMIQTPRDFAMDPGGSFLIVANQTASNALVFRLEADGKLIRVGPPVPVAGRPSYAGAITLP